MGNIKKVEHTTLKNYLPLEIIEKTTEAEYCNKIENTFQNTLNILETVYGIDTTPLQEKKIILMSEDLGRTCNNNKMCIRDSACSLSHPLKSPTTDTALALGAHTAKYTPFFLFLVTA